MAATYHIKIAGSGTKEEVAKALRELGEKFQTETEEQLADPIEYEDETLIAEWFEQ